MTHKKADVPVGKVSGQRTPVIRHLDLTEEDFLDRFIPIPNMLSEAAGFDFGEGGCLFASSGRELAYVRAQPIENVWTVIEGDDGLEITDGMHVVNRLGYLVTTNPCPPETIVTVTID